MCSQTAKDTFSDADPSTMIAYASKTWVMRPERGHALHGCGSEPRWASDTDRHSLRSLSRDSVSDLGALLGVRLQSHRPSRQHTQLLIPGAIDNPHGIALDWEHASLASKI